MNEMNQIDLQKFFLSVNNLRYCVVKYKNDFSLMKKGEDIDIFCEDLSHFSNKVIIFLSDYIDKFNSVKVKKKKNHNQIDLVRNNQIILRFDLFSQFPKCSNYIVKSSLFDVIIERSFNKDFDNFTLKIPNLDDECLIRHIEYMRYGDKKKKHKHFIERCIEDNSIDENIFKIRIHKYFQKKNNISKVQDAFYNFSRKVSYIFSLFSKALYVLNQEGASSLFFKVKKKLK